MIDYDHLAADYARHRRVHPEVVRALASAASLTPACRVLEVGCGTGNYVAALATAGCSCSGVDPSAAMLGRAAGQSPGIHFQLGAAERLPFAPGSFDLVFSVDVIHHVGDRAAFFREAHRVLKPGGQLCTATDSPWIIRNRQPLATYFPETVDVDLARYPAIEVLREWMGQAGFTELREETVEFPYVLTDLAPYRDRAFSCLHLIPGEAHRRGIERMERDLRDGPLPCASRYLLLGGSR
jgi:SAM-dependent methyltransferase